MSKEDGSFLLVRRTILFFLGNANDEQIERGEYDERKRLLLIDLAALVLSNPGFSAMYCAWAIGLLRVSIVLTAPIRRSLGGDALLTIADDLPVLAAYGLVTCAVLLVAVQVSKWSSSSFLGRVEKGARRRTIWQWLWLGLAWLGTLFGVVVCCLGFYSIEGEEAIRRTAAGILVLIINAVHLAMLWNWGEPELRRRNIAVIIITAAILFIIAIVAGPYFSDPFFNELCSGSQINAAVNFVLVISLLWLGICGVWSLEKWFINRMAGKTAPAEGASGPARLKTASEWAKEDVPWLFGKGITILLIPALLVDAGMRFMGVINYLVGAFV